ncbi:hypothetical protein [Pseudoduganella sp. R-43]|uniref:hypothetical protein n=1 Tax=unclassified Pseudoduganella TaxID=2637179 RepID=UPI003CED83F3
MVGANAGVGRHTLGICAARRKAVGALRLAARDDHPCSSLSSAAADFAGGLSRNAATENFTSRTVAS